jgi:diamine N-acetyltransferase
MTLEDVGPDNWRHCAALEVEESQRPFVAPVPYYLALCAYDEGPWRPIAVRVADEVVGFMMWGVDSTDGGYWIGGPIIDRRHQRRGYGRAAVLELLERAALAGHREAASYDQQNRGARSLYANLGFVATGEFEDGEAVARKHLT